MFELAEDGTAKLAASATKLIDDNGIPQSANSMEAIMKKL